MLHWEFMFTADAATADWIIGNKSETNLARKKVSGNRQVRSPKSKVPVSTSITDNEVLSTVMTSTIYPFITVQEFAGKKFRCYTALVTR
jgi:hypothetical protein